MNAKREIEKREKKWINDRNKTKRNGTKWNEEGWQCKQASKQASNHITLNGIWKYHCRTLFPVISLPMCKRIHETHSYECDVLCCVVLWCDVYIITSNTQNFAYKYSSSIQIHKCTMYILYSHSQLFAMLHATQCSLYIHGFNPLFEWCFTDMCIVYNTSIYTYTHISDIQRAKAHGFMLFSSFASVLSISPSFLCPSVCPSVCRSVCLCFSILNHTTTTTKHN